MGRPGRQRMLALWACTVLVLSAAVAWMSASWNVVALGDSVTTGANCDACVAFPALYRWATSHALRRPVSVNNLGVDGATSDDLVASLASGPAAAAVRRSDIVTVTIGANDLVPMLNAYLSGQCGAANRLACFDPALAHLRANLDAILRRVQQLRAGRPTAVRVTGYWNVFIDGAVAAATYGPTFVRDSSALTRKVNDVIEAVTQARQVTYVDLYTPFKGAAGDKDPTPLLAPDGDHPSQTGHHVIAKALDRSGLAPLRPPARSRHGSAPSKDHRGQRHNAGSTVLGVEGDERLGQATVHSRRRLPAPP